jgi:hypothetical protein
MTPITASSNPTSRFRSVDTPALQMRGQIDGVKDPRRERLANGAVGNMVAQRPVRGGVPQMMIGAHDDAGGAARVHHPPRGFHRQRQRFLAQHVLASRRRRQHLRLVPLVGRADIDRVDVRIGQQLINRGMHLRDAQLRGIRARPRGIRTCHGDDLAVGLRGYGRRHPFPPDRARPDQPPPHRHTQRSTPRLTDK